MSPQRAVPTDFGQENRRSWRRFFDDTSQSLSFSVLNMWRAECGLVTRIRKCDPVTRWQRPCFFFRFSCVCECALCSVTLTVRTVCDLYHSLDNTRKIWRKFFFIRDLFCPLSIFVFFFFFGLFYFLVTTHSLCADSVKEPSNKCVEWRILEWPQKPKSRTRNACECFCADGRHKNIAQDAVHMPFELVILVTRRNSYSTSIVDTRSTASRSCIEWYVRFRAFLSFLLS